MYTGDLPCNQICLFFSVDQSFLSQGCLHQEPRRVEKITFPPHHKGVIFVKFVYKLVVGTWELIYSKIKCYKWQLFPRLAHVKGFQPRMKPEDMK